MTEEFAYEDRGGMVRRVVRVFLILDSSGSMQGEKISALNAACSEVVRVLRNENDVNSRGEIELGVITFSTGARWLSLPVPVDQYQWVDLRAGGLTDMGAALREVASQLDENVMPRNAFAPVLVLVSDGSPSDDLDGGLAALDKMQWASVAVRAAISVGQNTREDMLKRFLGSAAEEALLTAHNAHQLTDYLKWVTVSLAKAVSQPLSAPRVSGQGTDVGDPRLVVPRPLPPPPPPPPEPWIW